jgi:predicted RNA polymerase sigma factor
MTERDGARQTAERVARASYGRLVAYLAARSRDVAAAEDALADAFQAALSVWPERGVPDNPEAWLHAVARRNLSKDRRRTQVRVEATPTLRLLADLEVAPQSSVIPDERLKLMFVCAHPAIDPASRAPLMLQTVLGLDAARIASAFLTAPAAMGQRLVRAKAKIRDAGIGFQIPEPADLPGRVEAVLSAIYAAYGSGWDDLDGADARRSGLTEEAIWLARLVVGLAPDEPEARGLLALMLYCEARRPARRTPEGQFIPLSDQDPALWSRSMIIEAEEVLGQAATQRRLGRFQLEAAIQSVHVQRPYRQVMPWAEIAQLYEGLVRICPTMGALVGRAAAVAEAIGPDPGLALLDDIPADRSAGYQPYWALRAHLARRCGDPDQANRALARAIGLTEDPSVRAFLLASAQASSA